MTGAPARSAADRLRAAYSLDLETEGIPVVLTLVGDAGPLSPSGDDVARADGARLAEQARSLHAELWPQGRQDDLFVTYAVLATVAFTDLADPADGVDLADGADPADLADGATGA